MANSIGAPAFKPWEQWPRTGARWPRYNVESDQANGLVGWWSCFGFESGWGLLRDVLRQYDMTAYNSPTIVGSEFGPVVHFDAASSEYLMYDAAIITAAPLTLACWVKLDQLPTANADEMTVMSIGVAGGDSHWFNLRADDTANLVQFTVNDAIGTRTAETAAAVTAGIWQHYCGVEISSSSRAVYLNGGNKGTDTNAATPSGMNRTRIGAFDYTGIRDEVDGVIAEARIYNRALSDAEVAALYARRTRWELHQILKRVWYVAAGADYTLTADAGTLSLTGQAASLLAGRLLGSDNGTLSLTGQAAALLADRLLSADNGTLAIAGQAAGLLADRLLTADNGALSLSGQAAALLAGRLLTADNGTLSLAGQDAGLTYSGSAADYTLTADSGAITFSGQSAALLISRLLTADVGTITISGQAADVLRGFLLTAESGAVGIAGQAAGLLAARLLTADSGTITLTGQDVALTVALVLSVGPVIRSATAHTPGIREIGVEGPNIRGGASDGQSIRETKEL